MLKIIFDGKERKFLASEGAERFLPDFVFGDKWNCRVRSDGCVTCSASETINGRYYETTFKISTSGLVTLNKTSGGIRKHVMCYKVRNWPIVGVISLYSGPIEERRVYFTDVNLYKEH